MKKRKLLFQTTLAALGLEGTLQAQTWDFGAGTQAWTDGANWNPDGVPVNGAVTINRATLGETPIITTTVDRKGADTFIGDATAGVLDINAGGSVDTSSKWIFVGVNAGGNGTLNINSGGSLTSDNDMRVGRQTGQGHIKVNGGSLTVESINNENVATNTFAFSNAAVVTTLNSTALRNLTLTNLTGNVSLQGGDQYLAAGNHDIASGGSFDSSGQIVIGNGVTSALTVNAGAGSVNAGSWIAVGIGTGGNGSLNMASGTVNASDASATAFTTIGANNNAVGEVTQTGGTWNQGGLGIILGEGGTAEGIFNLDGGTLNTPRIYSGNGNANLNLNGGTLRATKDEASFISANVEVNVEAGGALIDTNGFNVTTAADLAGVGSLDKQGLGSLNLAGSANSLDSATVSAGTLYISGVLTTANGITVDSTATIAAGDADGGLINGNLSLDAGATIDISLGELTIASGGTVSFGSFGFDDIDGFDVMNADNGTYTILAGDFTLNEANISNFGFDEALDMGEGRFAYFEGGSLSVVVIPEPSAALLGGLGALALLRRRRR